MAKRLIIFFYTAISVVFLVYMLWPYSANSIEDFSSLPNSIRSKLSGDTTEVPNLKAYYSNNYRDFVISYYYQQFWMLEKMLFPPLKLNYPPEFAFQAIKDQTHSTYLEEFTYPFRASLFINGLEPFEEDTKNPRYPAASNFEQDGYSYETKVTMRYYPSSIYLRIVVWLGINVSVLLLWKVGKKVLVYD